MRECHSVGRGNHHGGRELNVAVLPFLRRDVSVVKVALHGCDDSGRSCVSKFMGVFCISENEEDLGDGTSVPAT